MTQDTSTPLREMALNDADDLGQSPCRCLSIRFAHLSDKNLDDETLDAIFHIMEESLLREEERMKAGLPPGPDSCSPEELVYFE